MVITNPAYSLVVTTPSRLLAVTNYLLELGLFINCLAGVSSHAHGRHIKFLWFGNTVFLNTNINVKYRSVAGQLNGQIQDTQALCIVCGW